MEVSGTFKVLSVVLSVTSSLLIVGGFLAPGWFVMSFGIEKVYVGLWYITAGRQAVFTDMFESNHGWTELQGEATVSVILGFVALICTVVYVSSREPVYRSSLVMLAGWCYMISALVMGLAVVRCRIYNSDISDILSEMHIMYGMGTPFSLIMCGIGIAIQFISTIIHFREFARSRAPPYDVHRIQPGQWFAEPPPGYSVTVHSTHMDQYPAPMENQPTPADCRDDNYLVRA